ncbi:MAG: hypothetical protein GVX96_04775 [Bacteroidetes bacterium]|jgi:hypothetical protein|nr:hypothetical protein [Bacteroidota bacterium]
MLAKNLFGKPLHQISKEDFDLFFETQREESAVLEFKSGEVDINDLYKEVCAFLNSEGGLILIGSPREKKIKGNDGVHKRVCVGETTPSKIRGEGWILQKLAANITPYPTGIKVCEILTPEGNFFIIEVPQSANPPHQCNGDGRYYIRFEKEAKPASHGIVQALFFNRQSPKMNCKSTFQSPENGPDNELQVKVSIFNESRYPADNLSFLIRMENVREFASEQFGAIVTGEEVLRSGEFEMQGKVSRVVLRQLPVQIAFRLTHRYQPFILSILIWGREFGMHEDAYIFDPVNFELLDRIKTGENEGREYSELVEKLQEIKSNQL